MRDDTEVMSLLVVVGDIQIRIIVGYGVQDNAPKEKKDKFWEYIEKDFSQKAKESLLKWMVTSMLVKN
jgi:hypothetical protein